MSNPAVAAAPLSPVAPPPRDGRYNFIVLTLDGLGFWLGMSYFSPTTILPLFVSYLTPSNVLVGAVPAVVFLCWAVPQLAGARALALQPSRKRFIIRTALLGRIPLLLAIGATAALAVSHPGITLFLFLTGFGLFRLSGGLNTPAYYDLVASAISPRVRARFLGTSQFLGGAVGAAGLIAGRRVLDSYPFPGGFVICFAIGFFFMTAAIGCMALVREPPFVPSARAGAGGTGVGERPGLLRDAGGTLRRDPACRRYLGGRILLAIGGHGGGLLRRAGDAHLWRQRGRRGRLDRPAAGQPDPEHPLLGGQRRPHRADAGAARLRGAVRRRPGGRPPGAGPALVRPGLRPGGAIRRGPGRDRRRDAPGPGGGDRWAGSSGARGGPALYIAVSNTILAPFHVAAPLLGGVLADAGGYRLTAAVALVASVAAVLAILLAAPAVRRRGGGAAQRAL